MLIVITFVFYTDLTDTICSRIVSLKHNKNVNTLPPCKQNVRTVFEHKMLEL